MIALLFWLTLDETCSPEGGNLPLTELLTPVSIVLQRGRSPLTPIRSLAWEKRHPQSVLSASAGKSQLQREPRHSWNTTPPPVTLRRLESKDAICECVCVLKCMDKWEYSRCLCGDFSHSASHATITTWGLPSVGFFPRILMWVRVTRLRSSLADLFGLLTLIACMFCKEWDYAGLINNSMH